MPQRILNKRHDYTFQVITELLERVAVNNLTSEDKSPNYVTSSKNADFDDNRFYVKVVYNLNAFDLQ